MSDTSATLLGRLRDRADDAAWQRMVAVYSPLIGGWLRRHGVSAGDADDLTQEVLQAVVRHLAQFRHNGRPGAFRSWLRTITVNCLRQSFRARRHAAGTAGPPDLAATLDQLEDPASDLSRLWDRDHDAFVLRRLLEFIEPEFRPATWQAFHRQAIDGIPAEQVAAEMDTTVNAVLVAKSRVVSRLRREAEGLVD